MKITLEKSGVLREFKTGFSWKYFFFGAWYVLFKDGFLQSMKHSFFSIITLSIYYWVQCFKYNESRIIRMVDKGWSPFSQLDKDLINKL